MMALSMCVVVLASGVLNSEAAPTAFACDAITHGVNGSCPHGMVLVPSDELRNCSNRICNKLLDWWEVATGAIPELVIQGNGFGCAVVHSSIPATSVLCAPAKPKPFPKPECVDITHSHAYPKNKKLISVEKMRNCKDYICSYVISPTDQVFGDSRGTMLEGSGYGCRIAEWSGIGYLDGMLFEPEPKPPVPPRQCRGVTLSATTTCPEGTGLISTDLMVDCSDYICGQLLGVWGTAIGASKTHMIQGPGYGCGIVSGHSGNALCQKSS